MEVEYLEVNKIKPYLRNAKKHPEEQVKRIAASIEEFGFAQPLVVDKDNVLVIGHGRLEASKSLGYGKVPVVRMDQLSDEQIKALRLADNKTAESDWDLPLMQDELKNILDINMEDFGFNLSFMDEDEEETKEEEDTRDPSCQHNVFENQDRMQFACKGFYGIPEMKPTQTTGAQMLLEYCFDGIPSGGTVAVSSVGVKNDETWNNKDGDMFKAGFDEMMNRLNPKTVLWYGDYIEGCEGNIVRIPSYYALKREKLNEMARAKKERNGKR